MSRCRVPAVHLSNPTVDLRRVIFGGALGSLRVHRHARPVAEHARADLEGGRDAQPRVRAVVCRNKCLEDAKRARGIDAAGRPPSRLISVRPICGYEVGLLLWNLHGPPRRTQNEVVVVTSYCARAYAPPHSPWTTRPLRYTRPQVVACRIWGSQSQMNVALVISNLVADLAQREPYFPA